MTSGQFSEADLDLLADYVGGALGGAEEADVERLVRDDPSWSEAYARIAPAMESVHGQLAAWGAARLTMPSDVTDRLAAALANAAAPDPSPLAGVDPTPVIPDQHLSGATHQADIPGQRAGVTGRRPDGATQRAEGPGRGTGAGATTAPTRWPAAGPGRAGRRPPGRRRWSRSAGPIAVAALVTAVAGLGIGQLVDRGGSGTTTSAGRSAADRPDASTFGATGPARAVRTSSAQRPVQSGTDYDAASLSTAVGLIGTAASAVPSAGWPAPLGPTAGKTGLAPQDAPQAGRTTIPTELARLTDPAALDACLDAVAAEHAAGTAAVQVVDFAAYEGSPSLVVLFADAGGARWAWVAGPNCGLPGSGADTRHESRVG